VVGTIIGSASVGGNTTPLSCPKPALTVDGNLMFAYQFNDFGTHAGMTAPAGWSLLTGVDKGSSAEHLKIWTKVASSEGASYSWPMGSGVDGCVSIISLGGVNTNLASWQWATPVWSANSQTRTAASVSGAVPGSVLLCGTTADMNNTATTVTPPSGMTELADVQSTTWAIQSIAGLVGPSNPSGTKAFVYSNANFWVTNGGIESSIIIPPLNSAGQFFLSF
jgi:hypothetical protein